MTLTIKGLNGGKGLFGESAVIIHSEVLGSQQVMGVEIVILISESWKLERWKK